MKKILVVFGTRPEAIKMAPLVKELYKYTEFNTKVCVTAQHREMLDQVLEFFLIQPNYDLDLMKANQTLNQLSARILTAIDEVLVDFNPDLVLVHGDTSTSSMVALAAFHRGIKIGHVEAGLRTFNLEAPFPEEFNRQVISKIANMHFAPTELNRENLINEGVVPKDIFVTGNTVIDSISLTIKKINEDKAHEKLIHDKLCINGFDPIADQIILITGHRRENFGDGFLNICEAIKSLAKKYPSYSFIYPVHLNPIVSKPVQKLLSGLDNIFLINPLDYDQFIYLLSNTYLVLTDSGGIQEEAPGIGKPVLVMRDVTERPEGVNSGTVKLVGTQPSSIIEEVSKLLNSKAEYEKMSQ